MIDMAKRKSTKPKKEKKKSVKGKVTKGKEKGSAKAAMKDAPVVQAAKPDPKNKLVLEYIIHSSPKLLYEFLTTPSGLSEWFADDVNINANIYSFYWDGAKQEANIISAIEEKSI